MAEARLVDASPSGKAVFELDVGANYSNLRGNVGPDLDLMHPKQPQAQTSRNDAWRRRRSHLRCDGPDDSPLATLITAVDNLSSAAFLPLIPSAEEQRKSVGWSRLCHQ